jgi:hypothetical protein
VMISQRLPKGPLDEGYNSSRGFRCPAMVLTMPESVGDCEGAAEQSYLA